MKKHPVVSARRLILSRVRRLSTMQIQMGEVFMAAPPGLHIRCYAYTGQLSANVAALVRVLARSGGRFVDGGSFVGQHAQHAFFASEGNCEVQAFEPDSRARQLLSFNLAESGADRGVVVRTEALSNRNQRISFHQADVLSTSHVMDSISLNEEGSYVIAEAIDLGQLVVSWQPSFIKLDLEGHEPVAMETLRDLSSMPILIVENNPGVRECAEKLQTKIFTMDELFPEWTRFSNLSDDLLVAPQTFVSEGFRKEARRELIKMLEAPAISWLEKSASTT